MGVSMYAGGAIASLASVPSGAFQATATLPIYTRLFFGLALGALACAIVASGLIPALNRMMLSQEEVRPARAGATVTP
jgi:POT family proton-dependent oligopeptide transporter